MNLDRIVPELLLRIAKHWTIIMPFKLRFIEFCRRHVFFMRIALLTTLLSNTGITGSGNPRSAEGSAARCVQQTQESEQSPNANAPSYFDEPLEKLIQGVPELRTLKPETDQTPLPMILEKTGQRVDDLFNQDFINLKAKEVIDESQMTVTGKPEIQASSCAKAISCRQVSRNTAETQRDMKSFREGSFFPAVSRRVFCIFQRRFSRNRSTATSGWK